MPRAQVSQLPAVLTPARQLLKDSIEAEQRAAAIAVKAESVVQAASVAVERARAEASSFADLDEDVVKSRLAALKGESVAKNPEEIRDARHKRIIAKEELETADKTLQVAGQELADARNNVERCHKVSASHATAALSESVDDVIALWHNVNIERERLRTCLNSLILLTVPLGHYSEQDKTRLMRDVVSAAGLPFGDRFDWEHLQRKVGEALGRTYKQADPGPGTAKARVYWKQFTDAVLADPTVERAPLPEAEELFG